MADVIELFSNSVGPFSHNVGLGAPMFSMNVVSSARMLSSPALDVIEPLHLLADAGLLQHERVTLHWEAASAFQERYPSLAVSQELFEIAFFANLPYATRFQPAAGPHFSTHDGPVSRSRRSG
ncbi:hypothetical protein [Paraburkholderia tuberum]|uniref:hypothetical protein n=1 Tax=Paraburkholderia tuberum TaxID=157910 RepID=UPI003CC58378